MKKEFEDGSFIDINVDKGNKICISIGAKSANNPLKFIVNSVNLGIEEFWETTSDVPMKPKKSKKTTRKKTKKKKSSVENADGYS